MKKLNRLSQILEGTLQAGAGIFLILILGIVFIEVVSRYCFSTSHDFMEEFSRWAQIWLVFLILGVLAKRRQHVGIEILPKKVPEKYKRILLIVFDATALTFAIVLFWSGLEATQIALRLGQNSMTSVPTPIWVIRLCVPIGALFLAFFSIVQLIMDFSSISSREKVEDKK